MAVRSDHVNTTVTIPPGSALQDYLCSGPLQSNMTVVLEGGEHRMASQPSCNTVNKSSITITGSFNSAKRTIVLCQSKTRVLAFVSVQTLTMERITFINCGLQLVTIENISIVNCSFLISTNVITETYVGAVRLNGSTGYVSITDSTFQSNSGGAVVLDGPKGNVIITDCTFQNNSAGGGGYGGAVALYASTGDVSITDCTFQNNSAGGGGGYGGAVALYASTSHVSIRGSTFQSNSASYKGGAVVLGEQKGDVRITDCKFQSNNVVVGGGGAVALYASTGDVSISGSTFQGNSASGGGAVALIGSTGNVSISGSTFQNNRAGEGGAVASYLSTSYVTIRGSTFQGNSADGSGGVIYIESTNNVSIIGSTFQSNSAEGGGGGGGAVMLDASGGDVIITGSTFQNNSAGGGGGDGGAVMLGKQKGDVSISDCKFQSNSAVDGGGAVAFYASTGDVRISGSTFQSNSGGVSGAVMLSESTGNVIISGSTFQNNSAGEGGAVGFYYSTSYVRIRGSTFQGNSADGSGGVIYIQSTNDVIITGSTFQSNSAGGSGGGGVIYIESTNDVIITGSTFQNNSAGGDGGGAVMLYGSGGDVVITGSTFQSNSAGDGGGDGGAVALQKSKVDFTIIGCTFQNNSASGSGGAVMLYASTGNVSITDCTFQNNNAGNDGQVFISPFGAHTLYENKVNCGGAIYTTMSYNMFRNLSITNNIAEVGAAIYASTDKFFTLQPEITQLILQDVVVKDNHCSYRLCAGAIFFNEVNLVIIGSTTTGSDFSYNSPQGAIQGEGGTLTLRGYITFDHNTGVNGGAISLTNDSPLHFHPNCTVLFVSNLATGYGGGIYNNGINVKLDGILCTLRISSPYPFMMVGDCYISGSITFIYNHALQGGHAIYAKPIYDCVSCFSANGLHSFSYLMGYFNITPLHEDINDTQVLSFPEHVDYCGCSDPNFCNGTSPYLITYPGRTVNVNITSMDQSNNLSPSVVYTQVHTGGINSQSIMLRPQQKAQWIGTVCGQIEYQIYGPENVSFTLLLFNDLKSSPTVINVNLLPCESGFELITNSSTNMMRCDCSPFLTSLGVICNSSDGTVTRNKTNWIGVYNNTLPALAQTCPLDYCNSTIKKLPLARPGYLCNGRRTGIICGHCHGNLSVTFGSSKCQECSDMWLTTLVMFAVLGVFLVASLFFLNLTITQGTLYGLIFYANVIQVNTSLFFNQSSILYPMQLIVSLVNLDLGLPMCFYNGMDDADKAGLQFVFPAYLLILTMATILFCHYCLQRSPTTSTSFFLHKLSTIIGERAVGVLSTLIYLSYSKLMRTVIDILTYSTVHLPTGDMYVWYYGGYLEYLRGKHTTLFVFAMATCTLFLLPYTFVLTFIPIIEQYSEHNRLFNYLHKKANQIKPMNDAHYAPYKGKWRWWLGARLWFLVFMYSLNPVYSSDRPSLLLTIQATMVLLFTIAQARIMPFGQSHQSNRCTNFYNQLYNSLDMFYLLNYTALAMSMSYILDQSSDQTQSAMVTVGVLVGLYVVMLMVTVLYHLIVAILKTCKMYERTKEKFNALFERKKYEPMVPIELDDPTNSTVGTTTVTVYCGLREPLCED